MLQITHWTRYIWLESGIYFISINFIIGFDFKIPAQKTLLVGLWLLTCFIIMSSYKATLNSILILPKISVPFRNVKEMVNQNEIKYGLFQKTLLLRISQVYTSEIHKFKIFNF